MSKSKKYRILVIGENWHGSDCTGLSRGFRALGHVVNLIGVDQFFPQADNSFSTRALRRLARKYYQNQLNIHIREQLLINNPNFVVIFKGNHIQPETLSIIRRKGIWLCNFYPDISFFAHDVVAKESWPIYDHIFSTKKHGADEMMEQLGLANVSFLQHGYDSDVHRPVLTTLGDVSNFQCDISFIGGWSINKEKYLYDLVSHYDAADLKIWGGRWESRQHKVLDKAIQGIPVLGDYYALAIGASKINLGLLQDQQGFAKSGDQVTSRTFHIPASGGFLLHERTEEVLDYFEEGKEIACFGDSKELVEKVQFYLANEDERLQIAKAGYERCLKDNSLANRAQAIIDKYESETND